MSASHARALPGAALLGAALGAAVLSAGSESLADETPSLALEPAPAGDRAFAVERAGVHGHLLFSARLGMDFASEPLVLRNAGQVIDTVVSYQMWLHALAAFSLWHRVAVSAHLPLVAAQSGRPEPPSGGTAPRPGDGPDLGDARLGARVKLLGSPEDAEVKTELAASASVWLPTASDGYAGDGVARLRAALLLEGTSRRLFWAWNGGLRTRPSEALPGALPSRVGTALAFGFAGGFFADARRDLALGAELVADLTVGGGARLFDPRATVAHLLLTGHYRVDGGPFEVGAALAPGLGQGAGSADYRVLFSLGYAPETPAPPPDEDEDDVPDKFDACPTLRGVPAADPLLHGCPESEPDRDGDAIPDQHDACPKAAGEPTGDRKTHGCPRRVDTDRDGVPDRVDACPREPGEPPPAGDGCPKPPPPEPPPPPSTRLVEQEIVLSQQVQFEVGTAVLRPESDVVLAEVARVLGEHPEVELVEVQGHTDESGTPDLNRRLGQERANRVVAWLVGRGVGRDRLSPKGYGSDRPIADNTTDEGRQKNRRVEFRVLKPSAKPEEPDKPGGEGK
ncbi:MAG TPA: OmpA family protein [Polyangiaceae bacterium]|nr:OmpA family protein [Polyangiaceae bacterium]